MLPSGSLLVADGRNGRVIEVAPSGEVLRELTASARRRAALDDPHDVRLLPNGHLLITDAPLGLVVEPDWNGRVFRMVGGRRRGRSRSRTRTAPSSSRTTRPRLRLGQRPACVDAVRDGAGRRSCARSVRAPRWFRFSGPRYAEVSADRRSRRRRHRQQPCARRRDESGELLWELVGPGTRLPFLNQPGGRRFRERTRSSCATTVIIASCGFSGSRRASLRQPTAIRRHLQNRRESLDSTADAGRDGARGGPVEVARTSRLDIGEFELRAFEYASGFVYLVLVKGEIGDGRPSSRACTPSA